MLDPAQRAGCPLAHFFDIPCGSETLVNSLFPTRIRRDQTEQKGRNRRAMGESEGRHQLQRFNDIEGIMRVGGRVGRRKEKGRSSLTVQTDRVSLLNRYMNYVNVCVYMYIYV